MLTCLRSFVESIVLEALLHVRKDYVMIERLAFSELLGADLPMRVLLAQELHDMNVTLCHCDGGDDWVSGSGAVAGRMLMAHFGSAAFGKRPQCASGPGNGKADPGVVTALVTT